MKNDVSNVVFKDILLIFFRYIFVYCVYVIPGNKLTTFMFLAEVVWVFLHIMSMHSAPLLNCLVPTDKPSTCLDLAEMLLTIVKWSNEKELK